MTKDKYIAQLEKSLFAGNGQQQKIAEILAQVEKNRELSDDDKLEIETKARSIAVAPTSKDVPVADDKPPANKRWLPRYDFEDVISLPDGLAEFGFDEQCKDVARKYAEWLKDVYLPTFHPMPSPEIQYPVATCLMLLNCKAILNKKQCIPIPYFVGRNGSGKTELAKAIAQHYPRQLWTEVRPNHTGSSIRDKLDSLFAHGEPGYCFFDNFHPQKSMERIGAHYDIILANCEESSISRISGMSNENGKSEYYTYCYKVFTSIFDPQLQSADEMGEISRRCMYLRFQESKPKASRTVYDWEGMCRVFQRMWGEESLGEIKKRYGKTLATIVKMNPNDVPIKGNQWVICQVPIAVGVYCGIFADIQDGINHFVRYFQWLKEHKGLQVGSPLSIVLRKYIVEELPAMARSSANNPYVPAHKKITTDKMTQADLLKYLQATTGFSVSRRDLEEMIMHMANLGYKYEKMGDEMGFVLDTYPKNEMSS